MTPSDLFGIWTEVGKDRSGLVRKSSCQSVKDKYNVWINSRQVASLVYHTCRTEKDNRNETKTEKPLNSQESNVEVRVGSLWCEGFEFD